MRIKGTRESGREESTMSLFTLQCSDTPAFWTSHRPSQQLPLRLGSQSTLSPAKEGGQDSQPYPSQDACFTPHGHIMPFSNDLKDSYCFTELASGITCYTWLWEWGMSGWDGVRGADTWPDVGPGKTMAPFFRKTLPNNPQGFCGSHYCLMGLPVFNLQIRATLDGPISSPEHFRGYKSCLTLGTQTFSRKCLEHQ